MRAGYLTVRHSNGSTIEVQRSPNTHLTVQRILQRLRQEQDYKGCICLATFDHINKPQQKLEHEEQDSFYFELMLYSCTLSEGLRAQYGPEQYIPPPPPNTINNNANEIVDFCMRALMYMPQHHIIMKYKIMSNNGVSNNQSVVDQIVTTEYTCGQKPSPLAIVIMELATQHVDDIQIKILDDARLF